MSDLHRVIAQSMVLYYALVGIWGVVLAVRKVEVGSAYRGALFIGVGLGVLQAVVGLVLLVSGRSPRDDLHFLYGLSVIVALGLVHQYIQHRRFSRALAYGLASLFMMGLSIRAITTGA